MERPWFHLPPRRLSSHHSVSYRTPNPPHGLNCLELLLTLFLPRVLTGVAGLIGFEGSGTLPAVPKDDLQLSDSVWVPSLKVGTPKKQLTQ